MRPGPVHLLVGTLVLQGLSGIGGGIGLVMDPSGEALGIPLGWLQGSPFTDYLVPGLVLLTVLGIAPLWVAYGVRTRRAGSWAASVVVGLGLLIWLGVEIAVIGYQPEPPLQLIYGILAVIMLAGAFAPSTRHHLST